MVTKDKVREYFEDNTNSAIQNIEQEYRMEVSELEKEKVMEDVFDTLVDYMQQTRLELRDVDIEENSAIFVCSGGFEVEFEMEYEPDEELLKVEIEKMVADKEISSTYQVSKVLKDIIKDIDREFKD